MKYKLQDTAPLPPSKFILVASENGLPLRLAFFYFGGGEDFGVVLAHRSQVFCEPLYALLRHHLLQFFLRHASRAVVFQPLNRNLPAVRVEGRPRRAAEPRVGAPAVGTHHLPARDPQRVVGAPVDGVNVRAPPDGPLLVVSPLRPLPNVAHRVEDSVRVGFVRVHGAGACVPVCLVVFLWERARPPVALVHPHVGPPRKRLVLVTAPRGVLPLFFRGQPPDPAFPRRGPRAIRLSVAVRNVRGRVVPAPAEAGPFPLWAPPVGSLGRHPVRGVFHAAVPLGPVHLCDNVVRGQVL
mmetsp:Transcript_59028/g.101650  ORF Transcript_59028/g.101650 Transcript_59028/m.101650 type:complete len:296 (-) Transcript_59028:356-1243(-)